MCGEGEGKHFRIGSLPSDDRADGSDRKNTGRGAPPEAELASRNAEIVLENDTDAGGRGAERTRKLCGARGEAQLRRRPPAVPGDAGGGMQNV